MAENNEQQENNQNLDVENSQAQAPQTYTQEQLEAAIKEAETKAFVRGKTETNAKWEKKASEREKLAKEEAEKQAKFEKMSELEKYKAIAEDSQKQYQDLQDKITLAEQREETRKLMKEKGLSESFLDSVLVFKNAEATMTKINEIKSLFDTEVQKAVEAKIPTQIPKQGNATNEELFSNEQARKILGLK